MSTGTTGTAGTSEFKPALWTPGDWNAFFGFGTNILVNMLVLTGLLRFVLKMPDSLVFGRILPALGLMMCLSTFYYAFLAYRLAQKTGRNDVCALPSGVSVPHMFIVTFVIMLPITIKTGDPLKGWSAGLVWVFFQSFILMIGGFIAPFIRKITPRAALLGTLAGVSVTFISMRPALEMYMTPQIGLVCFAIILVSWFGGVKYWRGIPAGLVAIAVGMVIAWGSNLFGLGLGGLSVKGVGDAFANFGFSVPIPAVGYVFSGFEFLGIILVTAIPFGIYDLVEAMDNVESAEAAGDEYPTTRVLTADGIVSLIGCLMGNPFINAVYIGHPGWKAMGGRIGYSAATGIMVVVLAWFGIISVLLALVPVVAISPILLYIGMLIGAQAFQTTPVKHAPAIVLALTPHLAAWGQAPDRHHAGLDHERGCDCRRNGRRQGRRGQGCRDRRVAAAGRVLSRVRSDGRRLHPRRLDPGCDRRLHHRARLRESLGIRAGWCSPDLLWLHARRSRRHRRRIWRHARGRVRLCRDGRRSVRGQQARRERALHAARGHARGTGGVATRP
ncbi:AGZA family xanthine/uracil permease-like MFS transporter [Bradyrhizobium sp. GM5.1]